MPERRPATGRPEGQRHVGILAGRLVDPVDLAVGKRPVQETESFRKKDVRGDAGLVQKFLQIAGFHDVLPTEKVGHQGVELRLVVGQGCRKLRFRTPDPGALLREGRELPEHRHGHVVHVPVHPDDLISRSAVGNELSPVIRDMVEKRVRIQVVPLVAGGNLRRTVEGRRHVGVFAVVIQDVRQTVSRLQHEAAAGHVVGPDAGHLRPGVVAVEPLAYAAERHAGNVDVVRLMGAFVDDEAVDAAGHFPIGHVFQVAGMVGIGQAALTRSRHGFGRRHVLPIEMGHGGGLLVVGVIHAHVGRTIREHGDPRRRHPHRAHRHLRGTLEVHSVPYEGAAALVGFHVSAQHAVFLAGDLREKRIIVGNQVSERLAPIPQEGVALGRRTDHLAGEHRHPGGQVVAAAVPEFGEHRRRPGLALGLVAVRQHILYAVGAHPAAGSLLVHVQIGPEIAGPGQRVQLVHLQAGRLERSRMVLLAGEGITETVDLPGAFRRIPAEFSLLEMLRHVDDVGRSRERFVGSRRGRRRQIRG